MIIGLPQELQSIAVETPLRTSLSLQPFPSCAQLSGSSPDPHHGQRMPCESAPAFPCSSVALCPAAPTSSHEKASPECFILVAFTGAALPDLPFHSLTPDPSLRNRLYFLRNTVLPFLSRLPPGRFTLSDTFFGQELIPPHFALTCPSFQGS